MEGTEEATEVGRMDMAGFIIMEAIHGTEVEVIGIITTVITVRGVLDVLRI